MTIEVFPKSRLTNFARLNVIVKKFVKIADSQMLSAVGPGLKEYFVQKFLGKTWNYLAWQECVYLIMDKI